ncbi:bifunctional oligoribonuclease/PAP phosphatase NrnA [Acidobacteriota bacterium]
MTEIDIKAIEQIKEIINTNERFLLVGHRSPDGDSICSQLALADMLETLGKSSTVAGIDPSPERFKFLPGIDRMIVTDRVPDDFQVAFLLECSDFNRTGIIDLNRFYTVNIDHHLQNYLYADCNWVNPKACAVGEMIFDLTKAMDFSITKDIAVNLYTSIITDTGNFKFSNTTGRTFEICAELVACGLSPGDIARELYENEPLEKFKLLARILRSIETDTTGEIAWFSLSKSEVAQGEKDGIDTDGFIDFTRSIRGVRVVIFLREVDDRLFKVSLRSKDDTNVAKLAQAFGGGGHYKASGCVIEGTQEEVLQKILDEIASLTKS